ELDVSGQFDRGDLYRSAKTGTRIPTESLDALCGWGTHWRESACRGSHSEAHYVLLAFRDRALPSHSKWHHHIFKRGIRTGIFQSRLQRHECHPSHDHEQGDDDQHFNQAEAALPG